MRPRLRHWVWILAFSLLPVWGLAQYQLVLEKPGAFKRIRIPVGEEIGIRVKGMDDLYVGELDGVKPGRIFIFGDSVDLATLDRIHLPRNRHWPNMLRKSLITAAIMYPIMMLLNVQAKNWSWEKAGQVAAVSGGAMLLQRPMKIFYWRRVHLGHDRWRLRVMPLVESL